MVHKIFIGAAALIAALMFGNPTAWAQSGQEQSPGMGGTEQQSGEAERHKATEQQEGAEQQGQAGMDKEEVKKVQEALKDKGHYQGPVDGILGPTTRAALKKFQSAQGLEATGELDEETKKQLGIEESGGLFQREPKSEGAGEGESQKQEKSQGLGR